MERRLVTGGTENLWFEPGVNLLVGRPNTGKTKWLQTLDYLIGDPGENPFEGAEESGLAEKYDAAGVELVIGDESLWIERRWRELGAKTKIFVNNEGMPTREFQQFLIKKLGIPLLNFPKGNPMSGQTWPELSFRMMLRHIYRQQRFWSGLVDLQPEGEQHACLLQFLGIAELIYTDEYGQLIKRKMEVERLKARRDQYGQTLDELARDLLSEPGLSVGATVTTVREAESRLSTEIDAFRKRRVELITVARDKIVSPDQRGHVMQLGEERASLLASLEGFRMKAKAIAERLGEIQRYRTEIADELDRMTRAEDAGLILADLKVTHCPACDQPITDKGKSENCFLCHQDLPDELLIEELGAVRLRFESDRLSGEFKETNELYGVLERDEKRVTKDIADTERRLSKLENELAPARQAVSALIQEEVSAIDMTLGELSERQRQVTRISSALEIGQELNKRIVTIEREIEPLQERVDESVRSTDFNALAAHLEDGMNTYLSAINAQRPGVWRHNPVVVDVTRSSFSLRVGARRWHVALGGTDTLYFLMAYQYGLLTLSDKRGYHYPGISIIDVPGEFSGEAVEDKENFIVQPFIDLLSKKEYKGAQLIITGASFASLEDVNRIHLTNVYVA
ncbi:MAG: hypothetical protein H7Y42_14100 [Chitinophagaceae bacterium]|nr:hypothetical protein [Chitinophagaceae bacterium]